MKVKEKSAIDVFAVTESEYQLLQKQFTDLCYFASWQLMRKNVKNNHTEDIEDIMQRLHMAIIRAGRYYKRQIYIEDCLEKAQEYAKDEFMKNVVDELVGLWKNRTKHGANKQKFGKHQEELLNYIVGRVVPAEFKPDPQRPLVFDKKFITYCKSITWNEQKSLGRKISRERAVRSGAVSLSEFDFMGNSGDKI
jgi:signal recognition particle subunit SEC65